MYYAKSLQFEDKPDYGYVKKLFKGALQRYYYNEDNRFDWELIRSGEMDSEGNIKMVADEKKNPYLHIPLATFIENEKHYLKYKVRKDKSAGKSENKSQLSDSTTPRSQLSKVPTLSKTAKERILKKKV